MLPLKYRIKILNKLAQAVPGAPASPASPASPTAPGSPPSPTSPTAPTQPESTTKAVVQPPPPFIVTSGPWAWIGSGAYNSATVPYIQAVANMLNVLMHYSTEGQYNLARNQNNLNSIDSSGIKSIDGQNAIKLAQLFYKTFINGGQAITPTAVQITGYADSLINSQPLQGLSKLNPTGQAAQQMHLSDTFRQTFTNYLNEIKRKNPIQQAAQR